MTTQELRELDAWIAEHVMGYKTKVGLLWVGPGKNWEPFHPTEFDSDAMDVLKKCAEKGRVCIDIDPLSGLFSVFQDVRRLSIIELGIVEQATTLELAIAKFARAVFTKQ